MSNEDLLPWVDIETFGLDARKDPIIEIGILVTDPDLKPLFSKSWLIWSGWHDHALEKMRLDAMRGIEHARYVLDMHTKNGLFDEAKSNGKLRGVVSERIGKWLASNDVEELPMCGSSVQFDRSFLHEQMKRVEQQFHYRNIDVSTIKELCRRYRPDLYERRPDEPQPHRAVPDLYNSIAEFEFYRREFFNV